MNDPAIKSFRESKIEKPELYFGVVSAVGTNVSKVVSELKAALEAFDYDVHHIKVTSLFPALATSLNYDGLDPSSRLERVESYIKFGDFMREKFGGDILAALTLGEISAHRASSEKVADRGVAYIIDQLKTESELDLFRELYGANFFQFSIYSARDLRVDNLARSAARDNNKRNANAFRPDAERLVNTDDDEEGVPHGQKVGKIFQLADIVINADEASEVTILKEQVKRVVSLIFGSNSESPNRLEYGMYLAHSAALRSLDLSRQVGAAIFRRTGEVASLGSNEVPKAGGGTYWSDSDQDAREYKVGHDSNDARKEELLGEVLNIVLGEGHKLDDSVRRKLSDSQFMDALEYGRIVHAEMCAITDAARLGISIKEGTLYCTTFPCHMCAKHIVAAGLSRVVFLEPYPKSLASDLHSDSIKIEGVSRGEYSDYDSVAFIPFYGVTPRRYRDLFFRKKRKDGGKFLPFGSGKPSPIISTIVPGYLNREGSIFEYAVEKLREYSH